MKAKISVLMDGELDDRELEEALAALARDGEARRAWGTYHLIRDALGGGSILSADFAEKVASRLAQEPSVLAPRGAGRIPLRARWMSLSAAASVAAVALVGWLAFAPRSEVGSGAVAVPVAQTPHKSTVVATKAQAPDRVPLPSAA